MHQCHFSGTHFLIFVTGSLQKTDLTGYVNLAHQVCQENEGTIEHSHQMQFTVPDNPQKFPFPAVPPAD